MPSTPLPSGRPAPTDRPPRAGVTLWLLRVVLTLNAAVAVAQPVLIGGYLDGHFDLVTVHGVNGGLMFTVTGAATVLAPLHAVVARGRWWPTAALVLLGAALTAQLALGYARVLSVHVVLGVAVVALAVALAVWSWTRSARRPRPSRRGTPAATAPPATQHAGERWTT